MSELDMLREMLAYWLPVLRLSDWKVDLRSVSMADLDGAIARNTTYLSNKSCLLLVSRLDSRTTSRQYDLEEDLVHEIVHLHFDTLSRFADMPDGGALEKIALEQPVEALSVALVGLRRQSGHRWSWERKTKRGKSKA